ncbi:MAG: alpha/beta fold hydrolase [Pyrinomonadaceae bacterium]|nr:alpha/beta fold hydrolase [Pyrinomonadaceae bacterium]
MRKLLFANLLALILVVAAFAQTAPTEKNVTIFGAKIRYLEAGDAAKPTVILLHGLGAQAESWQFNITFLAQNYRVIALDQIGFGKSDKPLLKYRVGTYVDFLDKFMAELKIEKASLVGNSMGGWVAALTAIKYPNRVEKIVLADAAGLAPKEIDLDRIYQLNNSTRDEIRANLKLIFAAPALQNNEAFVDQFMTQRIVANDGYTINSLIESIKRKEDFLDNRLSEIKKPTLIIWGRQDGLLPLSDGEKFNKGIAGSQLVVFDNCGHVPQFEKAADFNKQVLEFLRKN